MCYYSLVVINNMHRKYCSLSHNVRYGTCRNLSFSSSIVSAFVDTRLYALYALPHLFIMASPNRSDCVACSKILRSDYVIVRFDFGEKGINNKKEK